MMSRRNSLRKSGTGLSMKRAASGSVQFQGSPADKKASSLIEFPSSPQAAPTGEIIHYTHLKHPLAQITLAELFVCSGCKDYGAGKRFACQQCDFQLHEFCASSPPVLKDHPLHGQHQLVFHSRPKQAGISWPKCNICGKSTKGFTFRCRSCSFQMHPCCAMFSNEIMFSAHPHSLKLLPQQSVASTGDPGGFVCGECKKKRSGRVFSCTVCDYHLHAFCAKAMINGLQANGIKPPEKPSMFGTAARLASQVAIEFIGGLVEGFGEGVGGALIDNLIRGRGHGAAGSRTNARRH